MARGESSHLPYAGVGPLYVAAIIVLTAMGVALSQLGLIPHTGWPVPAVLRVALCCLRLESWYGSRRSSVRA